ncbi:cytochrome c biogenesis protein ResB [Bacillus sp. 165]|uniref:cytochrome c biogenesis protein ResB n=1 Tax=Bacillus sp. 165 TaxID=1529117 RepID=UPI001ADB51CE|nr:cytochrome c biogenesis protein ResB [Bacillus sp. 165]MBO9128294.1 cytochrome c biogenesis protein ResB [Bacillus sp. 165]
MEQVKCECGHANPVGTIFCEACGKPFQDEHSTSLLDMRYEGSARRSITYKTTIIDKIWIFFSSVKVGVWIIILTLVASAIGTIYPQEMYIPPNVEPSEYYADQYGTLGKIYYELGFQDLYSSWWYMLLIASLGMSLVICSIDRVVPLYKALNKQRVTRHPSFLQRQRLGGIYKATDEEIAVVKENLEKKRYTVRTENGNILAEKGRFSRWGPYVNHVGLIIFLIGAMLRFVPGMYVDEALWVREGETKAVPGTEGKYYVKNEKFIMEVYDKSKENQVFENAIDRVGNNSIPKNFQSNVILYEAVGKPIPGQKPKLKEVKDGQIRVNEPLKYDHYALYQVDYKLNEFSKMYFTVEEKATGKKVGPIAVDLTNPKDSYTLDNEYSVKLLSYFPDFYFDEDGNPNTKSKVPNNPAFVFKIFTPQTKNGEVSFVAIKENIEPLGTNKYKMSFAGIDTRNVTALTVRKDFTLWILGLGGAIFMIGVIQGMYWNHRRVWIQKVQDEWWFAGFTNKNWYGLRNEIKGVLQGTTIPELEDKGLTEKK